MFDSFFWTRLEKCLEDGKDISSLRKSKVYFICMKVILYMLGENQKKLPEKKQTKEKKKLWNVSDLKRLDLPNVKHSYSLSRLPANLAIICTNKTIPLHIRYITHV